MMLKLVSLPTSGLMLGIVSLGLLLEPYCIGVKYFCGIVGGLLWLVLLCKFCSEGKNIAATLKQNSILASVMPTFYMTTMQLCVYAKSYAPGVCEVIWLIAVLAHTLHIIWFSYCYILHFKLANVYPSYLIPYVGYIVASVTAPAFGYMQLGSYIFWFGFPSSLMLLVLITYRYFALPKVEPATLPLLCIYTAPMSMSLAGYYAVIANKSITFITVLQVAGVILFFFVLLQMPKLLKLPFYPSYAAFTFPFVITVTALKKSLQYYALEGITVTPLAQYLLALQYVVATSIVFYVLLRYAMDFRQRSRQTLNA